MKDIITKFALGNNTTTTQIPNEVGDTSTELVASITGILNAVIGVLGLVCVVVMIIGGVNYMTSSGDAGKVKKAKDTILYALIGLIICVLSFAIINWTIDTINNSTKSEEESEETEEEALIVKYKDLAFLEKSL